MPDQAAQQPAVMPPDVSSAIEVPEPGAPERQQTASHRSWWIKFRTALVLALISLALFLVTLGLYPSTTQLPVPLFSTVALVATQPVATIIYEVKQVSSSVAEMEVTILLPAGAPVPPASTPVVGLVVSPPIGTKFTTCPAPACKFTSSNGVSAWKKLLGFKPVTTPNGSYGIAYADFFVRAHGFGGTYNAVNASVVAPVVEYHGSGTPTLLTQYNIPHAAQYDWSVFPLAYAGATFATWSEPVTNGQIPARVADGTDFANQGKDNYHTFLAGVILGLAGGALLTALQEILNANKK